MTRNAICFVLTLCALSSLARADGEWRVIDQERGIKVTVRDEPGRELPTFRGQGKIRGRVLELLAVVMDAPAATKWAEGADEARVLRTIDARTHLIYTRTKPPWPVSDRDIIMRRTIQVVEPGKEFHVRLVCAPNETPPLDGVVRVKTCDTYFHLRYVDEQTTFVEYQVNLDPGGSLPQWLIAWASKKIPMKTLIALEKYSEQTGKQYAGFVRDWADAK